MSFFYPDEMNKINEEVDFDYPKTDINQRHIEKNISGVVNSRTNNTFKPTEVEGDLIKTSKLFYSITLPFKKPNFNYSKVAPMDFVAKRMYLTGLLHNNIANTTDNNKSIVGEIIVEHKPQNAVNRRIFSCFLLEYGNETSNDMDNLISFISDDKKKETEMAFDMNSVFKGQPKCIRYESGNDFVFVFLKPVTVSKKSADFVSSKLAVSTDLFTTSAPTEAFIIDIVKEETDETDSNTNETDSNTNTNKSNTETFIGSIFGSNVKEGIANSDIYIDCQPIDESDETDTAFTSTVMNSGDSQKQQTNDFFKITSNFFLFIMVAVVSRMIIPHVYKIAILTNIIRWKKDETTETPKLHKYIRMADYTVLFLTFVYLIHYLRIGMTTEGKGIYTIFFMLLAGFAAFGYTIIKLKKRDSEYMTVELADKTLMPLEYVDGEEPISIGFVELIKFPFLVASKALTLMFAALWFIFFVIYSIFIKLIAPEDSRFWISEFFFFNTTVFTPLITLLIKGSI
jgi:hypothetical protein